jgi:GntR family transcriptional regulator, transcriptional repressor for pyruvate dehydrogenase complex
MVIAKRETLSAQLVRELGARIEAGEYKRGEQLPTEKDLIDEFGVSRTVVREAIANLRASGLVATRQGIGAFVVHNTAPPAFRIDEAGLAVIEDVVRALELRIAVESEAAALAAIRRTPEALAAIEAACDAMDAANAEGGDTVANDIAFHQLIAKATNNAHFLHVFNYLGEVLIPRTRVHTHSFDAKTQQEYISRVNGEHRRIASAIRAQDSETARASMRMHLGGSRDRLVTQISR